MEEVMKNHKELLILLIIVSLTLFNLSNDAYAQQSCELGDRPCKVNSDCLNDGICRDLGNCSTFCECKQILREKVPDESMDHYTLDYSYGRNCENIFMCDECWIKDNAACFYFTPETEAAAEVMSGCLCNSDINANAMSIVGLSCPSESTSLNRTNLKKKIHDHYTGAWIGELTLIHGYKEHAILKICARDSGEIEVIAHSLGYFQHAFYSGKDIQVYRSGKELIIKLKNKSEKEIRTIFSLIDDRHAFVILPEGNHFKMKKIDSHVNCRKLARQGKNSITKDEFDIEIY